MDVILEKAALIVIDVQEVLDDPDQGELNNPEAEENIVKLLQRWRKERLPVFHVQYISPREKSPFHKDAPGTGIKESVKPLPGEPLIVKHFESAFMKTNLEERLKKANLQTLIFVGFYTDQCVAATVKGLIILVLMCLWWRMPRPPPDAKDITVNSIKQRIFTR
jgi:nicotinamidase-related amidase